MKISIWIIIFFGQTLHSFGQAELREVFSKVFFEKEVYERIFFEYKGKTGVTFMSGYKEGLVAAFVLPDTNIQRFYPDVLEVVGTSHGVEENFMTSTFIAHPYGKVFFTSHVLDPGILLLVNFDKLLISKKKSLLSFHTTSLYEQKSLKNNYVKVYCELTKKRRGWKITTLKIEPQPCCSKLW